MGVGDCCDLDGVEYRAAEVDEVGAGASQRSARQIVAHHYIDAAATNSGEALKELVGAQIIVASRRDS